MKDFSYFVNNIVEAHCIYSLNVMDVAMSVMDVAMSVMDVAMSVMSVQTR